jgi:predicted transcriptional regulator
MAAITIREEVWHDLVALARQRRRRAQALAEEALRDYLQRAADEELLARSERVARRAPFHIEESEEVIRRARQKRKGR